MDITKIEKKDADDGQMGATSPKKFKINKNINKNIKINIYHYCKNYRLSHHGILGMRLLNILTLVQHVDLLLLIDTHHPFCNNQF